MPLTPDQKKAVETSGRPLFIQAGAGTGKTFTLTNRLAYGLSEESGRLISSVENLLTITFTNKAAGELMGRVRAELRRRGLMEESLSVDAAWISTIHSMCRRILLAHAFEAGIDPGSELLSEEETADLLGIAIEGMLRSRAEDPGLQLLLSRHGVAEVCGLVSDLALKLELSPRGRAEFQLGPARRKAGITPVVNLFALFGDAKAEIDELGLPEGKKTYLNNYNTIVETLDALDSFLNEAPGELGWAEIDALLSGCKLVRGGNFKEPFKGIFAELQGAMKEAKGQVAAECARDELEAALELAQGVAEGHRALKEARGALDTNDLLIGTYRLLEERPEIAAEYRERFQSIMVDEFQDTDSLQVGIIERFCDEGLADLATVGDAQQSIYGFRGADLEVYRGMRAEMRAKGSQEVKLATNFRSHPDILGFVEDIFSTDGFFGGEFLKVEAGPENARDLDWVGAGDARVEVLLSAGCKDPENARRCTGIDALRAADAASVADEFERLHAAGAAYGDMAILMQSIKGSKAGPYLEELRRRGIPCVISGGSDYYTLPEVKTLSMFLRFLEDRDDDEALFEVLGSPLFDMSDDDLLALSVVNKQEIGIGPDEARRKVSLYDALAYQARRLPEDAGDSLVRTWHLLAKSLADLQRLPLSLVVMDIVEASGWHALLSARGVEGRSVQANIQRFCDLLDEYESSHGRSVFGAAEHFRTMCELAEEGSGARGKPGSMIAGGNAAVQIMTIHSSKGLEFPIVAVAEYERSSARASLAAESLTEDGESYLALSDFPDAKTRGYLRDEADDPGSFAAASDQESFAVHALALSQERAAEEQQRLFYVALTRARDLLILVAHDSRYASTGELSKGLVKDALEAVYPEGLPQGESVTVTRSGAKVVLKIREVPCGSTQEPAGKGEQELRLHLAVRESERPEFRSWIGEKRPFESYSSLAAAGDMPETLATSAIQIGEATPETVSPLGSAFHLVAQWVVETGSAGGDGLEERCAAAARRYGLEGEQEERLRAAVESWLSSARFAEARAFPEHHAEYAFCVDVEGMALEGSIDLLCLDAVHEKALVIDYKTGTSGEGRGDELRERYSLQAACYAYAVLSSGLARETELVFVRPEAGMEEVAFSYGAGQLELLKRQILGR